MDDDWNRGEVEIFKGEYIEWEDKNVVNLTWGKIKSHLLAWQKVEMLGEKIKEEDKKLWEEKEVLSPDIMVANRRD